MKRPVLALLTPNEFIYSETFIHAHQNLLDATVLRLYGGYLPNFIYPNGNLVPQNVLAKIFRKIESVLGLKFSSHQRALTKFLIENNVNVVLAEYGLTGAKVYNACKRANIPLIIHFHGFDAHSKDITAKYKAAYREMFEYASHIVCVSGVMCRAVENLGAPKHKIVYNVYGPNPEFHAVKPNLDGRNFIAIGRFVDKKAPQMTIKAFHLAWLKYPDAKLVFCGDGPLLDDCKKLAQELLIQDAVQFMGPVNLTQIKVLITQSVGFLQHSVTPRHGDMEGTPLAVLEASAAGLPVISTVHAGIPDVIVDGETGFLVPEYDWQMMGAKIIELLDNPKLAKSMGENGKERVISKFSLQNHLDRLNKLIWEVGNTK